MRLSFSQLILLRSFLFTFTTSSIFTFHFLQLLLPCHLTFYFLFFFDLPFLQLLLLPFSQILPLSFLFIFKKTSSFFLSSSLCFFLFFLSSYFCYSKFSVLSSSYSIISPCFFSYFPPQLYSYFFFFFLLAHFLEPLLPLLILCSAPPCCLLFSLFGLRSSIGLSKFHSLRFTSTLVLSVFIFSCLRFLIPLTLTITTLENHI